ncbi:MAG: type II toxin-antitoxin system HicA family toxin [Cyanobacteria bacterium J06614_10]
MGRIRQLRAAEVEKILRRYNFQKVSQKGSHRKWRNVEQQLVVIVPYHKGRTVPLGTLKNIMTQAKIPQSEWQRD